MEPNKLYDLVNTLSMEDKEDDEHLQDMLVFGGAPPDLGLGNLDGISLEEPVFSVGLEGPGVSLGLEEPEFDEIPLEEPELSLGLEDLSNTKQQIDVHSYVDILNYLSLTPLEKDFLEYAHTYKFDITISNNIDEIVVGTGKSVFEQDFNDKYDVIKVYIQTYYNISVDRDILVDLLYERNADIFRYINFPFRRVTGNEIRAILNVYDKEWYVDYVLPLFAILPANTSLLISIMEQGRFDKDLFLDYIEDEVTYGSFLRLYANNRFDKATFDLLISTADVTAYTDTVLNYDYLPLVVINNMFANGHGDFLCSLVEQYGERVTKVLSTFEDIPGFLEYPHIADVIKLYIDNNIFNRFILENYLFKMPQHKWLLELYQNGDALFDRVQYYGDLYIAKFIYDCESYGYNCYNLINGEIAQDAAFRNVVTFLIMQCYNHTITMTDYKKWLVLLCYRSMEYYNFLKVLMKSRKPLHFNRVWYELLLDKLGCKAELVNDMPSMFILSAEGKCQFIRVEDVIFNMSSVLERICSIGVHSTHIGAYGDCTVGFFAKQVKEPGMLVINDSGDAISFPLSYYYKSSLDNVVESSLVYEDPLRYNLYSFRDSRQNGKYTLNIFNEYYNLTDEEYSKYDVAFNLLCDKDFVGIADTPLYHTFIKCIALRLAFCYGKANLFLVVFYTLFGKYISLNTQDASRISEDKIHVTGRFGIKEITWNTMLFSANNLTVLLQTDHFTLVQNGGKFTLELS